MLSVSFLFVLSFLFTTLSSNPPSHLPSLQEAGHVKRRKLAGHTLQTDATEDVDSLPLPLPTVDSASSNQDVDAATNQDVDALVARVESPTSTDNQSSSTDQDAGEVATERLAAHPRCFEVVGPREETQLRWWCTGTQRRPKRRASDGAK